MFHLDKTPIAIDKINRLIKINIATISSVDLSAFGGPILPGSVSGHQMALKVWDASAAIEYDVTYDIKNGKKVKQLSLAEFEPAICYLTGECQLFDRDQSDELHDQYDLDDDGELDTDELREYVEDVAGNMSDDLAA